MVTKRKKTHSIKLISDFSEKARVAFGLSGNFQKSKKRKMVWPKGLPEKSEINLKKLACFHKIQVQFQDYYKYPYHLACSIFLLRNKRVFTNTEKNMTKQTGSNVDK